MRTPWLASSTWKLTGFYTLIRFSFTFDSCTVHLSTGFPWEVHVVRSLKKNYKRIWIELEKKEKKSGGTQSKHFIPLKGYREGSTVVGSSMGSQ